MSRDINRRDFLKLSGGTVGLFATAGLFRGPLEPLVDSHIKQVEIRWGKETTTVCPYCSGGCGLVCYTEDDVLVRVEGDTAHPINHGSVCPKGGALAQIRNGVENKSINSSRLQQVMYRAPGAENWEIKDWDFALERISRRIKDTRDHYWMAVNNNGRPVNRTSAIASLGGATINNEECYLLSKMLRALGIVKIQHQSIDGPLSGSVGLNSSLGCGAMTNHWTDLSNSDCILFIGANIAENHPPVFLHAKAAQDKGATIIDIDPRFTRTSAKADIHCSLRPGTDLALLGGLARYVLDDIVAHPDEYNIEYITKYTDASFLLRSEFAGPVELNGLFSGFNTNTGDYRKDSWKFQTDSSGDPISDMSLQNPACVFQHLKRHFSRYDTQIVSEITGVSKELLEQVYRAYASTGATEKAGSVTASSGVVQQVNGTQTVRAITIVQLLLGNIGVAGGGVNVFNPEFNAQGALDHGLNSGLLPGYLAAPDDLDDSISTYVTRHGTPSGLYFNSGHSADIIGLLKSWYGDGASLENDFNFGLLPKVDQDDSGSLTEIISSVDSGMIKGMLIWGENPSVSLASSEKVSRSFDKLEWMVVTDLFETETAAFWKRPGVNPGSINTEVILLPSAASFEKEGSATNAGRWMQWSNQALEPLGDSRPELWIIQNLMSRLKRLYADEGGPNELAINDASWDSVTAESVAKEINGRFISDGTLIDGTQTLADNGSVACGNRLYKGSMVPGMNMASRRDIDPGGFIINLYHRWAWSWPNNTRVLHNGASINASGKAFNISRTVIEWDQDNHRWIGDVPHGFTDHKPGSKPFIGNEHGLGKMFAGSLKDGPFPEYYEPWESPAINLISARQNSPLLKTNGSVKGEFDEFPIIGTTFTVGEHWGSGKTTRRIPWLLEMSPEPFIEIGQQLADVKGIKSGDLVVVRTARGQIKMKALVTLRLKQIRVLNKDLHHIAAPSHWGFLGPGQNDSAQTLTAMVADVNSAVAGSKVFLCDVTRG
ncbi:formate dehydrogenase, alpha subunit [Dehalogenimonas lykanthroporepellens BL-DC-9]|jgi:formate dehydrogenase major subunit|nr:formate dehydrogenase, alpha subunit [Dehalogenimonas lykanthroporepellens BL-DC-9]